MKPKVIFFGNGPLAKTTLDTLSPHCQIIFHATTSKDLVTAANLKQQHPDAFGILASFGVLIRQDFLDLFEPTGILNLHPSLLPKYRGPSPIETAILHGDRSFSVSIMKLVKTMDAGPVFHQITLHPDDFSQSLPDKSEIYQRLAIVGATWLIENLQKLPEPQPQNHHQATFTTKLTTKLSPLNPQKTATELLNQIRAFQNFPKSKYTFFSQECIILSARISDQPPKHPLYLTCADKRFLVIDRLQPVSRKPMDSSAFLNGIRR